MPAESGESDWPLNYFNYFTEIEEHFQRTRGTCLFLLSPLDWALIESWKSGGVPLAAVLRGIDDAFEKFRSRKTKRRAVNSLAYCAQAVMEAAQRVKESPSQASNSDREAPFAPDELRSHLESAATRVCLKPEVAFQEIAASLRHLAKDAEMHGKNLEDLERWLTSLEDKMVAAARSLESDQDLYELRARLDAELRPYRGKMTAEQIAMLERRYLDTAILERASLPRLSLFYLHSL